MKQFGKKVISSMLVISSLLLLAQFISCKKNNLPGLGEATLTLKELKYKEGAALTAPYTLTVGHDVETLDVKDFHAKFDYATVKDMQIPFETLQMPEGKTKLVAGEPTVVSLKITGQKGLYQGFEVKVTVTRSALQDKGSVVFKVVDEKGAEVDATKAVLHATARAKDAPSAAPITSGSPVATGTVLTFTLEIKDATYEIAEWIGAAEDNTDPLKAMATKGDAALAVTAKLQKKGAGKYRVKFATDPVSKGTFVAKIKGENKSETSGKMMVSANQEVEVVLTITDDTLKVAEWVCQDASVTVKQDPSDPKKATFKMPSKNVEVTAKLKVKASKVNFSIDILDKTKPKEMPLIKAKIKDGAAINSGAEVPEGKIVEFELKIQRAQEGDFEYEYAKWEGASGSNTPAKSEERAKYYTATVTVGKDDVTVVAKVKPIWASLSEVKLVVLADASKPGDKDKVLENLSSSEIQLGVKENGMIKNIDFARVDKKKVRLDVKKFPEDATITFHPEGFGKSEGGNLTQGDNVITVKVKKAATDGIPEYKEITYKYNFKLSAPEIVCDKINLGDHYDLNSDDIKSYASTDEGFSYTFDNGTGKFDITCDILPKDATVVMKCGSTPMPSPYSFTPTETEQTVTIEVSKAEYASKKYTLKLQNARKAESHELIWLKIGKKQLDASELTDATGGTTAEPKENGYDGYSVEENARDNPPKVSWKTKGTVEVSVKKESEASYTKVETEKKDDTGSYKLPKVEVNTDGNPTNYPIDIKIEVKDGTKLTVYKLRIDAI